jgi:hypothetical protein
VAEFSPQELDQLEDALEGIEDVEDVESLGLSEGLTERLGEYRLVLEASREAMPMEDVAEGLLDGVLAEAREAKPTQQAGVGLWERWRKTLIPVFALAGTTAAVLLIVRPDQDLEDTVASAEMTGEPDTAAGAQDPAPTPAAAGSAMAEEADDAKPNADAPAAAVPPEEAAKEAMEPARQAVMPEPKQKKEDLAQADAIEEQVMTDKDGIYAEIERADGLRLAGNCVEADRVYRKLKASSPNSKAEALIEMGLGLCDEVLGGDGAQHYSNARAADPSLEIRIDQEREAMKGADRKGKPYPKKKRKSTSKSQNAYDALGD